MPAYDKADLQRRMNGAVEALRHDLGGLRTGRASISLLEPVHVEVYGANMPLNQVATISVPEPRMLTVQVWDRGMIKAVDKAIRNAGLGLNPVGEGQLIRVPLPELSQERRQELVKVAHKYAEQTKVAIRNVRRDAMQQVQALLKDKKVTEDEERRAEDDIQKLTDRYVKSVDEVVATKEQELLAL